jgi:hypothetical protein
MYEQFPDGARQDKVFCTNTSEYDITIPPKDISILTKEDMEYFVERGSDEPFQIGDCAIDEAGNIFLVDGFAFFARKRDKINALLVWTKADGSYTTSSVCICHHISMALRNILITYSTDTVSLSNIVGCNMKELPISYTNLEKVFIAMDHEHGETTFNEVNEFLVKKLVGFKGIKET